VIVAVVNLDFTEDFDPRIDINRLDVEVLRQPSMAYTVGAELATARRKLRQMDAKQKITEARLKRAITASPAEYEIGRVTVDSVEAVMLTMPEWIEARKAFADAEYAVGVLEAAQTAMVDRRRSLEQLCAMFFSGQLGNVKIPDERREQIADINKQRVRGRGVLPAAEE